MTLRTYPTQLRDHLGNEVRLPPKPFAVGGEGAVFDVQGRPDLVAKLYSKPQSKERCDKLRAMAKLCSPNLLKIAAWPTATLSANGPASVDGILMPKVSGYSEIHHLYSVAQRKKEFPEADWGFLLHTARNCAIAFEEVHGHGHVVGDVNQKNVMVSKKGIVAFVDCDSFQVAEGTRIFRCGVGVPEYTPPELHGKNFASLDRAANHDLFGLAVLVFHLLMMGRHPFSGVPLVKAEIPIEKAIQEGCYAYTRHTAAARLKPPPHVPPTAMLDSSILDLFERAFRTGARPTASEWRAGLDAAMKSLARCKNDPRHSYLTAFGKCPWCEMISTARLMFFLPSQGADASFRPEDIEKLVQKLANMEILFTPYARPKPRSPVRVSLPAELRAPDRKPVPATPPAPPAQMERPSLKPRPVPPAETPRPKLKQLPPRPPYPESPSLSPPDPFLPRLCAVGVAAGFFIIFIAEIVGFIMMVVFAAWWMLMMLTENRRRENALASLNRSHRLECGRIDEEYAILCEPMDTANKRLMAAWQTANAVLIDEYEQSRKKVDEENHRRLKSWELNNAARMKEHERTCQGIEATNRRLLLAWEAANAPWIAEERKWRNRLAQVEAELTKLEAELSSRRAESLMRFETMKRGADRAGSDFKLVKRDYDGDIGIAQADSHQNQLEEHLDKYLIREAKLKGITTARIIDLESFGVETAKDVAILETQKVPGIGPVLSTRLFVWRDGLAASFVPKQTLPEKERNRIASRYAPVMLPLSQSIEATIRELESIISSHRTLERGLLTTIAATVEKVAAIEAHLKALHKMK